MFTFKVQIDGKTFVSEEDVTEACKEIRANGGVAKREVVARHIAKERLEELFPDDTLLKLNEVLFAEDLADPDIHFVP